MIYHIRKINGVVPPIPAEMDMTRSSLDLDPQRTASGDLNRNVVAKKMKFELTMPSMNKTDMTAFLLLLAPDAFEVEYEDMFTGAVKTGTFYSSADIKVSILSVKGNTNADVRFKEFKVSLIEY